MTTPTPQDKADFDAFLAEIRAQAAAMPPPTPGESISELRALTACTCDPAWTDRGRHETRCCSDWRKDVDVLAAAIQRVRDLHQPNSANDGSPIECAECSDEFSVAWPCSTLEALDGAT